MISALVWREESWESDYLRTNGLLRSHRHKLPEAEASQVTGSGSLMRNFFADRDSSV